MVHVRPGGERIRGDRPPSETFEGRRSDELERRPGGHGLHRAAGLHEPGHHVTGLVGGDRTAELEQDLRHRATTPFVR